jgi:hypothetical protein
MSSKVNIAQFSDSQDAIREYIHSGQTDDEKWGNHTDIVKVRKNRMIIFNGELDVISLIETNESFVEIIWPKEYEEYFYIKYSNMFQQFEYDSGTLVINCRDRYDEEITIFVG